jgi:hypothetical protein
MKKKLNLFYFVGLYIHKHVEFFFELYIIWVFVFEYIHAISNDAVKLNKYIFNNCAYICIHKYI